MCADVRMNVSALTAFPLTGIDLQNATKKYGGSLAHWVGELMHISTQTRIDL